MVSGSLTELIATQWSRQNPSEAARWVEGLSRQDQARYAYRVADAYVAQKPSEALAWALRLAGSPQRYLWSSMLGQMAKYDPDQALQIAQAAESPAQRAQAMGKVLAAIAQTNPSMAMTHLQKMPSGRDALGDPRRSRPRASRRWRRLRRSTGSTTSTTDTMQLEAAQSLGWALSRRNVEAAAQLVDRVPKEARANWITAVALGYAEFDVEKGCQWVRRYANDGVDVASQFARAVASRNPELAMQLVSGVTDDQERDRLLGGLLPPLAENSPALAARWAEKVTDEEMRTRSIGEVASVWAQYDLPAARKWILSLSDGPREGSGAHDSGSAAAADLSTTCSRIINQIQTPERRSHAVLMAAMRMSQNDMDGARTLLRRYPLDPARQRQFDDFLQRRSRGQ